MSSGGICNIASRLRHSAAAAPHRPAVIFPAGRDALGRATYSLLTFQQLDRESDRLARGLASLGIGPGTRIVLMVPPSLEFIALTFALFKTGSVVVLIDPGMGRTNIFRCLEEIDPSGFVAIPIVHWIRRIRQRLFPNARKNVRVGRGWGLRGIPDYASLLGTSWEQFSFAPTLASDPAAVIFTSGSTGPPKGVVYEHGMFDAQVDMLRDFYGIEAGEIDLSGFPLFALFNAAMGVTTVVPDMNPTRPAEVDPAKFLEAIENLGVTQSFGSPAIWNRVGRYCVERGRKIPSLRRVLSAGAPVPLPVIDRMRTSLLEEEAEMFTPYGATESLPVASLGGREILEKTAPRSRMGAGTCVGRPFPGVKIQIIAVTDGPLDSWDGVEQLPTGAIGEIIVQSPSTTREYFRRPDATALAKIPERRSTIQEAETVAGEQREMRPNFWHRMGDVGYLDAEGLLWFCGRKAHRVQAAHGTMFTIPCEAIFNQHPRIFRSALVGLGEPGRQLPVIVAEPEAGCFPETSRERDNLIRELLELGKANRLTESIQHVLLHRSLPVDIRHNVKIFREKLVPWAAKELGRGKSASGGTP